MRSRIRTMAVLGLIGTCALAVGSLRSADDEHVTLAKQILEATGVKGGLVVHLGCGDGKLTAALHASESYLVHGLDPDARNVEKAREHVRSLGLYGTVSVDQIRGGRLPYIDNLVNLLVAEDLGEVRMAEVRRVLAPNGVAYTKIGRQWMKNVKPRPTTIDEWTHYLHDASNNAVAHDTVVGPPRQMQWIGGPRYSRHHDHMSAISAMVSTGGRLFYIFDHASPMAIQLPSKWLLVGRDAFSGTILWQRPIDEWYTQMFRLKSGPAQLTRRLVAMGERVYVTLGLHAPVSALDAATGRTIRTYRETENTEEIILSDGVLFLLVNDSPFRQPGLPSEYRYTFVEGPRRVVAVQAESGKVLWNASQPDVLPLTLTADARRVYFHDGEKIVCLDRSNGSELWHSEPQGRREEIPTFFAPTLVAYEDVLLFSGGSSSPDERNRGGGTNTMCALSAETGTTLWTAEHPPSGYKSPEDILVVQGLVWTPATTVGSDSGVMIGRDPHTGEVKKEFLPDVETHWFHHRCHRAKATDRYILTSRTGIEFVDPQTEHWTCHHWVRGGCLYGIMPANGMIYNPPHPCACYLEAKLYGFNALAPESPERQRLLSAAGDDDRLERGPAYGFETREPAPGERGQADWPTYRRDAARSGRTKAPVPADVQRTWERELGGRLSSLVVADGKVFVASIDTHSVHALAADSGDRVWSYTVGGRVDSPPTVWEGRVLFGSADGHVYCLRADDGKLIWRFRAAPVDLRMTSFEQLESVWPVHGSVLVRGGVTYCVAGRSMFLDGGLRLLQLDARTGRKISETIMDDRVPDSGENLQVLLKGLNMPVALPDVLSCDGKYIYMRSQRFDLSGQRQEIEIPTLDVSAQKGEGPHLFCPTGFLDDVWWHRSYWLYGRVFKSGAGGYYQAGRVTPAGRPMVFDEKTVWGYGRKPQYYRWTTPMEYQLFAAAKQPELAPPADQATAAQRGRPRAARQRSPRGIVLGWAQDVPVLVRAMVLAGEALFIAGPPDLVDEGQSLGAFDQADVQRQLARQAAALEGSEGALLWAVSTHGEKLTEQRLDSVPVFDGMAAANGRLYLATIDGKVLCYGGGR
ncbi:MAG: PQQ-binding-like beta-propeller repeat protein [Armatimonadota bacterium]